MKIIMRNVFYRLIVLMVISIFIAACGSSGTTETTPLDSGDDTGDVDGEAIFYAGSAKNTISGISHGLMFKALGFNVEIEGISPNISALKEFPIYPAIDVSGEENSCVDGGSVVMGFLGDKKIHWEGEKCIFSGQFGETFSDCAVGDEVLNGTLKGNMFGYSDSCDNPSEIHVEVVWYSEDGIHHEDSANNTYAYMFYLYDEIHVVDGEVQVTTIKSDIAAITPLLEDPRRGTYCADSNPSCVTDRECMERMVCNASKIMCDPAECDSLIAICKSLINCDGELPDDHCYFGDLSGVPELSVVEDIYYQCRFDRTTQNGGCCIEIDEDDSTCDSMMYWAHHNVFNDNPYAVGLLEDPDIGYYQGLMQPAYVSSLSAGCETDDDCLSGATCSRLIDCYGFEYGSKRCRCSHRFLNQPCF